MLESDHFLKPGVALDISDRWGTPAYVYDEASMRERAAECLSFPNAFGLTVRYAIKAASNANILRLFDGVGLKFDASAGHEVRRALHAGISVFNISLSSQEMPPEGIMREFHSMGLKYNACSLHQLKRFGELFPGARCGIRFNPGMGSGSTGKTNVGGKDSSFGIWHEYRDKAATIARDHGLVIERIHTHIGSGSDPGVWQKVAEMSLEILHPFPEATTLNLGGGYKVARVPGETATDLQTCGAPVKAAFEGFQQRTGRKLTLEIEPGTYLVANAGALLASVNDVVSTGENGRNFIKLNCGMTEILRPSLYAAQHPIIIYPQGDNGTREYVVVGHCCESGDLLTTAPDDPETIATRTLPAAQPGDLCVIGGTGAYCATMCTKNYNSFPEAPEVLLHTDGTPKLIRRRQTLEQLIANEVPLD